MRRPLFSTFLACTCALTLTLGLVHSDEADVEVDGTVAGADVYDLSWHTIDGGGGTSTGSGLRLDGTIGQPHAGAMSGGSTGNEFTLNGGYWAGASSGDEPTPVPCLGDLTGPEGEGPDGEVNGFDLLALLGCWGEVTGGACAAADLSGPGGTPDGTVDGFDLLALLGNWGPCS